MQIGYCRVSTEDQNPDLQLRALKKAGCKTIYTDKVSGTVRKRTYLERCLQELQAGDVLVVWKLDRLGRSLRDLIALLDDLKTRGVAFRSLTESIDTATPTGRAMWHMIGILAEWGRSLIQEGTQALTVSRTGDACPHTARAGGKPCPGRATPQGVTADVV